MGRERDAVPALATLRGRLAAHVQVGIGLHLLSHTHIDDARASGSSLQFGERLAWGINFGAGNRYEVTLLLQHVSNGRIREPNNGLTYFGATFGMPID